MANFMDFLFGKNEKTDQFQKYTPDQEQSLNMLLGGATKQLPQGFDFLAKILSQSPEAFKSFEEPAMKQFQQDTIPSIAERFSGMNAQKSSAFGQQLGKAGANLSSDLAQQRSQLSFNALNLLQQLLGTGLTPQFDTAFRPGTQGALGGLLEGLLGIGSSYAGGKK